MKAISVNVFDEELNDEETVLRDVVVNLRVGEEYIMGLCTIVIKDIVVEGKFDVNGVRKW